jgi:hypothetical protein
MIITKIFYMKIISIFMLCGLCFVNPMAQAATVVQRDTISRSAPSRVNNAARMPAVQTPELAPVAEEVVVIAEPIADEIIIANKSAQFDAILGGNIVGDNAADARGDLIAAQRAALDAADARATTMRAQDSAVARGTNACDTSLRECMRGLCGNDFAKCAGDGDTDWGNKMNSCRAKTNCTASEFTIFTREIKADRDNNAILADYTNTINCGNSYMKCISDKCGAMFGNCIGKSNADSAISACDAIAKSCATSDNGLANRMNGVFATIRQTAEQDVATAEARLYELRELMSQQCQRLGAMFDERSLDCVFTVNFFANNSATPMASKKLYAGDVFDCTPDWFGVDVTTFRENAYRLTREQTAASSALMGAGLGVAAGALASGAIDRAMDSNKADNALDSAECENGGGSWNKLLSSCLCGGENMQWDKDAKQCAVNQKKVDRQARRAEDKDKSEDKK